MAVCVTINANGTLSPTGEAVNVCTGYVMVSGSEYGVYQVVQTALSAPTPAEAAGWVYGTWGLVMTIYLVSRIVGAVASFFDNR